MKLIPALAVLLLAMGELLAQDQQPFSLAQRVVNIPESGLRTNLVFATPTRRFVFEPPRDAKLSIVTSELRLVWVTRDLATAFHFRLLTNAMARSEAGQKSGWPNSLRERFPGRAFEEFPCYNQTGEGRGFDLHYVVDEKFRLATRLARFPLDDGIVEFEVTCPESQFAQRQMELSRIINSFAIENPASR
jgi:hypothetical protein